MPDRQDLARLASESPVNPESLAIRSQQAKRLREAIQESPPQYRIILVLRDMQGLTDEEVSDITGLGPGNIRVRLHRARLFVRQKVARQNQTAPAAKESNFIPSCCCAGFRKKPRLPQSAIRPTFQLP